MEDDDSISLISENANNPSKYGTLSKGDSILGSNVDALLSSIDNDHEMDENIPYYYYLEDHEKDTFKRRKNISRKVAILIALVFILLIIFFDRFLDESMKKISFIVIGSVVLFSSLILSILSGFYYKVFGGSKKKDFYMENYANTSLIDSQQVITIALGFLTIAAHIIWLVNYIQLYEEEGSPNLSFFSAFNLFAMVDVMCQIFLMFNFGNNPPHPAISNKRLLFWVTVTILVAANLIWIPMDIFFEPKEAFFNSTIGTIVIASVIFFRLNMFLYWLSLCFSKSRDKDENHKSKDSLLTRICKYFSSKKTRNQDIHDEKKMIAFIVRGAAMAGITVSLIIGATKILFAQLGSSSNIITNENSFMWAKQIFEFSVSVVRFVSLIVAYNLIRHKKTLQELRNTNNDEEAFVRTSFVDCWRLIILFIILIAVKGVLLSEVIKNYETTNYNLLIFYFTQILFETILYYPFQLFFLLIWFPQRKNLFSHHVSFLSFLVNFETTFYTFYIPFWLLTNGGSSYDELIVLNPTLKMTISGVEICFALSSLIMFWGIATERIFTYSNHEIPFDQSVSLPKKPSSSQDLYMVLYSYKSTSMGYLSVERGDSVVLLEKKEGWYLVKDKFEREGLVPSAFITPI